MDIIDFIIRIIIPSVMALAMISRMGRVKRIDERWYALIEVLVRKEIIDVRDLSTLKFFEPQADVLDALHDLLG